MIKKGRKKLFGKDCIDREAVLKKMLKKIEDLLCRGDLTAEQRIIVTELGNFIVELPREKYL